MANIVIDDEQAQVLADLSEPMFLVNRQGKYLGIVTSRFTPEEIAEFIRRSKEEGPRSTTEQVFERLRSLEQT